MRRLFLLLLALILVGSLSYGAPSNTISIPNGFTALTTAQSGQVNGNFNEVQSKFNAHSHTDITQVGTITTGTWNGTKITPQYGGTGQDFSAVASASIIYFGGTGTMTTLAPGSSSQVIAVNAGGTALEYVSQAAGAKHSISRGFEVSSSTLKTEVTIYSGTLYHGTTCVDVATNTVLVTTTGGDYSSGSAVTYAGGAGYNYIGVSSSASQTTKGVFFLGTIAPQYSDAVGNTDGTKLYTKIGSTYYRVLGAIPINTSNQCAAGLNQSGSEISYVNPLNDAIAIAAGASTTYTNTAFNVSTYVPTLSTLASFAFDESANANYVGIRQTGVAGDGTYVELGTSGYGFLDNVSLNSSQSADYMISANAVKIGIKGYRLNIR